jgi:hypothetical protein
MSIKLILQYTLSILLIGCFGAFSADSDSANFDSVNTNPSCNLDKGLGIALPSGFYGTSCGFGLSFTYGIKKNILLRFDANCLTKQNENADVWMGMPTLGLEFHHVVNNFINVYDYINGGLILNISNFHQNAYPFFGWLAGLEIFARGHGSFYAEIGFDIGITKFDIALKGNSVVAGGVRYYFKLHQRTKNNTRQGN